MLTQRALITAKAEYLVGRVLTAEERKRICRIVREGSIKELHRAVEKLGRANRITSIASIVEAKCKDGNFDKLSHEDLMNIIKDMVIKTGSSVQSGLKMLAKVTTMKREALLKYIFNVYLRDAAMIEKYTYVKKGNRDAITNDQAYRQPIVENALGNNVSPYRFENTDKESGISKDIREYDPKTNQLINEFNTRPLHSEDKKGKKPAPKGILITPNFGRPTNGDPEGDTIK